MCKTNHLGNLSYHHKLNSSTPSWQKEGARAQGTQNAQFILKGLIGWTCSTILTLGLFSDHKKNKFLYVVANPKNENNLLYFEQYPLDMS